MQTSRRHFLTGVGALALVGPVKALAAPLPPAPPPPPLAWAVGQGEEWNWRAIKAPTQHEAIVKWMGLTNGTDGGCEDGGPFKVDCGCEECSTYHSIEAYREPLWDGQKVKLGGAHWYAAGMGANCTRCNEPCFPHDNARLIADRFVCDTCTTPAERGNEED